MQTVTQLLVTLSHLVPACLPTQRQADADDPDGGGEAGDFDAAAAELVEAAGGPGKRC